VSTSSPTQASAPAARRLYARRGYGAYGEPLTFTSWDRADADPRGWMKGWFEDGHLIDGFALEYVAEPSWRCAAPVMAERKAVA
jgi:hypothetical protein